MIKALIRLRGCAGLSAPLLFAIKKSQDFPYRCPYDVEALASWPPPENAPWDNSDLNEETPTGSGKTQADME